MEVKGKQRQTLAGICNLYGSMHKCNPKASCKCWAVVMRSTLLLSHDFCFPLFSHRGKHVTQDQNLYSCSPGCHLNFRLANFWLLLVLLHLSQRYLCSGDLIYGQLKQKCPRNRRQAAGFPSQFPSVLTEGKFLQNPFALYLWTLTQSFLNTKFPQKDVSKVYLGDTSEEYKILWKTTSY